VGRPYSKEFPRTKQSKRYLLDDIPVMLWIRFNARCKRRKQSMRARLLQLVMADVNTDAAKGAA
jgi:hypothetical protein